MNQTALDLALKKQRLQIAGAALRADFSRHAAVLRPICSGGDLVLDGGRWLRQHPEIAVGVGAALIVARPKLVWRWSRRAFFAWQAWRKLRRLGDRGAATG